MKLIARTRSGSVVALALAWLLPLLASAETKRAVLAVGDCSDPELLDTTSRIATGLVGAGVLTSNDLEARLDLANHPQDALRARLTRDRVAFYDGNLPGLDEELRDLLNDVKDLPPGAERTGLSRGAHLLRALIFRNQAQPGAADNELRAVLRGEPKLQLSANDYSPSFRTRFEQLRLELDRLPEQVLRVTSEPSGAAVYLDGHYFGTTPHERPLASGPYALELTLDNRRSFPRQVSVPNDRPTSIHVSMVFAASLRTRPVPCVPSTVSGSMSDLVRFAKDLSVDLVIVELKGSSTSKCVQTSIMGYESGGMTSLECADVVSGAKDLVLEDAIEFGRSGRRPGRREPPPSLLSGGGGTERPAQWRKPTGIALGAIGGGALVAGTYFAVRSAASWRQYDAFYGTAGQAPSPEQARLAATYRQDAEAARTWAAVSLSAGVAGSVTSAILLVIDARAGRQSAGAIRPVFGLSSVAISGALP